MGTECRWLKDAQLRRSFDELGFASRSDVLMPFLRQTSKPASDSDVTVLLESGAFNGRGSAPEPDIKGGEATVGSFGLA
jgi:hypothetical protein